MNSMTRTGDKRELIRLISSNRTEGPADPIGFPWHEDIAALAASAACCALCAVVQAGIDAWQELYRDIEENNKGFIEFHKDKEPMPGRGDRLWLAKRFSDAPGFVVLIRAPRLKSSVYLMTGVAFATEEGGMGHRSRIDWLLLIER